MMIVRRWLYNTCLGRTLTHWTIKYIVLLHLFTKIKSPADECDDTYLDSDLNVSTVLYGFLDDSFCFNQQLFARFREGWCQSDIPDFHAIRVITYMDRLRTSGLSIKETLTAVFDKVSRGR